MTKLSDGPIVYISDDEDDQFLFQQAVTELGHASLVRLFGNGLTALDYLTDTDEKPLLILCDIDISLMSGLELRHHIDGNDYLREKSIPLLFYTTEAGPKLVKQAYEGTIQGFHLKEITYPKFKQQIHLIITYWQSCLHPNSF